MQTPTQTETKNQIIELEKKLLNAFQEKNLVTLEELIHADALFILPNGLSVTKADVLNNYRTGNSAFTNITASNQIINVVNNTAIVSLNLQMQGNYFEKQISAQFRYLRVWKLCNNQWQVIATSGVPIQNP
ncbi:MAG TPA: nuclear transport factor 2 family protein [Bacteroidia bacterium]|nr:nuclear transport factor 2 family protein [Bacteroidia bacterium]